MTSPTQPIEPEQFPSSALFGARAHLVEVFSRLRPASRGGLPWPLRPQPVAAPWKPAGNRRNCEAPPSP